MSATVPPLVVLVDTREQAIPPFPPGVEVQHATLAEADYTTRALLDLARIERKSPSDLAPTLSHARERFDRGVQRLQRFRWKCVVVEGDLSEVYRTTRMHPHSNLGSMASLYARWDVPVLFTVKAAGAGWLIAGLLRRWEDRLGQRVDLGRAAGVTCVTCWPSLFRPGEGRRFSGRSLLDRAKAPRAYPRRQEVPRWSGAEFLDGYRSLACFVRASWVVLDFDRGTARDRIEATFGDLAGFAHTTWSSAPGTPRWRVALVLSRAVDRDEHDRVWRAGAALAERAGLEPDFAARDASRAWAFPAMRPGYQHAELTGAPFDVRLALATFPAAEPEPVPLRRWEPADDVCDRVERASRYLAAMPGAISGSGGHATTFRAAVAMVCGFELEPEDALRLLVEIHNPMCAPPWSTWELRHKVKSAATRARLAPGWLAERRRSA